MRRVAAQGEKHSGVFDTAFVAGKGETFGGVANERRTDHRLTTAAMRGADVAMCSVRLELGVSGVGVSRCGCLVVVVAAGACHFRPMAHVRDVRH